MSDLFFPSHNISIAELEKSNDAEAIEAFLRYNTRPTARCAQLLSNWAYCMSPATTSDRATVSSFDSLPEQKRDQLMCVIDDFGSSTRNLAALYDRHLSTLDLQTTGGLVGAGATASSARLNGFQKAIIQYQKALIELNNHRGVGRGASADKLILRNEVRRAYDLLQREYRVEMKKVASPELRYKNRGSALNSAERGITVAQHRRGRHLYVSNTAEAQQVARLARNIRYAGNGMVALDAGIRVTNVYDTYRKGGNWQREASIEATGFGMGGAAAIVTGKAVVTGLTAIGLGLTPVGWVLIIGAAVAAVVVALTMCVTWLAFGRLAARLERRIAADGVTRPCPWDGPGARIVWYAWAIAFPVGRFNRLDDPLIDVGLVRRYATRVDKRVSVAMLSTTLALIVLMIAGSLLGHY